MFDSMLQLASSKSKELEAMLREVARASAEAEVMATWSKVNELEALLATARREAREARQLALEEVRSPCELEQMLITARQEVRSPRMEAFAARSSFLASESTVTSSSSSPLRHPSCSAH